MYEVLKVESNYIIINSMHLSNALDIIEDNSSLDIALDIITSDLDATIASFSEV